MRYEKTDTPISIGDRDSLRLVWQYIAMVWLRLLLTLSHNRARWTGLVKGWKVSLWLSSTADMISSDSLSVLGT